MNLIKDNAFLRLIRNHDNLETLYMLPKIGCICDFSKVMRSQSKSEHVEHIIALNLNTCLKIQFDLSLNRIKL